MAEKVVDPPIASDDEVSILPEPPKKVQKDVVVVLSSDEDDQLFEKCRRSCLVDSPPPLNKLLHFTILLEGNLSHFSHYYYFKMVILDF